MMLDKISIVVPVYNTGKEMLVQCFDSIINQTYKNIELIIVDDGSKQETANICDKYCNDHQESNIRVMHNKNGGASVARNTGIEISTGTYITFIDADDWVDSGYIEFLYSRILELGADIVMCTRMFEYRTYNREDHFFNNDIVFENGNKRELIRRSITTGVAGTWCKLYKKGFITKYNLRYDIQLRRTQDIIFNLYAFHYASKIAYLNNCIYHYRMQNDSVTKKFNKNADVILTLAAKEFRKYVDNFYCHDEDIIQDVYYKCLIILNEIFKLKLYNPQYQGSKAEKFGQIKNICAKPIYSEAINKINSSRLNLMMKTRVFCLRKKHYRILAMMYKIQLLIEHWRNFS